MASKVLWLVLVVYTYLGEDWCSVESVLDGLGPRAKRSPNLTEPRPATNDSALLEAIEYVYYRREHRGSPFSDLLLFETNGSWSVYDKRAVAHKLIYRDGNPVNASYYCRAANKHWFKFKNPPDQFKEYFFSLPKLVKSYDNERLILAHDGSEWLIFSKITENPVRIEFRDTDVKFPAMYRVRATDSEWYTFVNPVQPFRVWIKTLPLGPIKHSNISETWDNDMLQCMDEEDWRINDTGRVRRIIAQGNRRFNYRHLYYVRCDNDWYKLKDPPEGFVKFLRNLPVYIQPRPRSKRDDTQVKSDHQQAGNNDDDSRYIDYCKLKSFNASLLTQGLPVSDGLLCKGKNYWYVRNSVGQTKRLLWQNSSPNLSRYKYARDEDGAWHKFRRPPEEFLLYLERLPRAQRRSDLARLIRSKDGEGWLVRSKVDDNQYKLVERSMRERLTDGNIMIQAKDEHGEWYSFVNPPDSVRKWMQRLPATEKSIMLWDNQRLFTSEDSKSWKVKDDHGKLRAIEMRGEVWYSAKNVYYTICDDRRWYKFKCPPKAFIAFISRLPTRMHDTFKPKISPATTDLSAVQTIQVSDKLPLDFIEPLSNSQSAV